MTTGELVDLSMPVSPDMPTNRPDHSPPAFVPYATIEETGWAGTMVTIDTHCGTHVDAPSHFVGGARTVDELPLTRLMGPAQVIRAVPGTDGFRLPAGTEITGRRVVVHTGASDVLPKEPERYIQEHSHLDLAFAEQLLQAGVELVGIDSPSLDVDGDDSAHILLLSGGVVVVENLVNTAALPEWVDLTVLPLRLVGLDGSPARAIALIRQEAR